MNSLLLDLFFYIIGGGCCFYVIYRAGIPFSSFAGVYLRLAALFIYFPGYYVYRGGVSFNSDSPIDILVYVLLLLQLLFGCLVAWFVWSVKIDLKLKFLEKSGGELFYSFIFISVLIYTVYYFYSYNELIPIFKIVNGDFLSIAATLRSDLTHGFQDSSIFSYYRPITKDVFFFLMFSLIAHDKTILGFRVALIVILSIVLLAHLEKAYLINISLAIIMLRLYNAKNNFVRELYIIAVFAIVAILITYLFFASSIWDAVDYIPYRLMAQIGYVPEQLQLSKPIGSLLLQGVNLGGLGRLLDIKFIDISKMAFESIHPDLVMLGISGSSAGLALADGYMIFGIMGFPLFAIIMYLHFYIDRLIRLSVFSSKIVGFARAILISFYTYFICFYPLYLIGSFFGIFNMPYIFQQGLLLCVLSLFLFLRIVIIRIRH